MSLRILCIFLSFALSHGALLSSQLHTVDLTKGGHLDLYAEYQQLVVRNESSQVIANVYTRTYCFFNNSRKICGIPGPTLKIQPGVNATLTLINNLTGLGVQSLDFDTVSRDGRTQLKDQDTINLHTHGLHINPYDDNIVDIAINPKCPPNLEPNKTNNCTLSPSRHTYSLYVPQYHYPGSYWYHSHWHGSVTSQVVGGMFGALQVEPPQSVTLWNGADEWFQINAMNVLNGPCNCTAGGKVPNAAGKGFGSQTPNFNQNRLGFPQVTACFMYCLYPQKSRDASGISKYINFSTASDVGSGQTKFFYLVNGLFHPEIEMTTGEWTRLRILNTGVNFIFWKVMAENKCDVSLLGTDGIWFPSSRNIWSSPYFGSIVIPPGARADVGLRCYIPDSYEIWALHADVRSTTAPQKPIPIPRFSTRFSPENNVTLGYLMSTTTDCIANMTRIGFSMPTAPQDELLARLIVTGSTMSSSPNPPAKPFPYQNTMYLNDTLNLSPAEYTSTTTKIARKSGMLTHNMVLPARPLFRFPQNSSFATGINNVSFEDQNPLLSFQTNVTHEWIVFMRYHPFHHHTWPFQVQYDYPISMDTQLNGWFVQRGDWRDTLGLYGSLVIRVNYFAGGAQANYFFTGKLIIHCHFVLHEDWGMMAWFQMTPKYLNPLSYDDSVVPNVPLGSFCQVVGAKYYHAGQVTVRSNVLDTNYTVTLARSSDRCYEVMWDGYGRINVNNFYLTFVVAAKQPACEGNSPNVTTSLQNGLGFRLQVWNSSENSMLKTRIIPIIADPPFNTVPSEVYNQISFFVDPVLTTTVEGRVHFRIQMTWLLPPPNGTITYNGQSFIPAYDLVFASGNTSSMTWSYGEGIGSSQFPYYQNQNDHSCTIILGPTDCKNCSTTCEFGYVNNLLKMTGGSFSHADFESYQENFNKLSNAFWARTSCGSRTSATICKIDSQCLWIQGSETCIQASNGALAQEVGHIKLFDQIVGPIVGESLLGVACLWCVLCGFCCRKKRNSGVDLKRLRRPTVNYGSVNLSTKNSQ